MARFPEKPAADLRHRVGILIAIHVSGLLIFRYNFWKIYLLGIPGQIAIFLWFRMFHPVSEKAEGTDNG